MLELFQKLQNAPAKRSICRSGSEVEPTDRQGADGGRHEEPSVRQTPLTSMEVERAPSQTHII